MEFIKKFKDYLLSPLSEGGVATKKNAPSKVTVKNYLADINHFVTWVELRERKAFSPTEITLQLINEFKADKLQTLSASSVERHISSLRKFFAFLKLNGDITVSPFDQVANQHQTADEWHLHDFKNYLYTANSSHLTIKNYIIDVKQFLSWAEEVLGVKDAWHVADKNILARVDDSLVEEYKNRLYEQHVFSASSINRKLSSLRKYLSWAAQEGYLRTNIQYPISNIQYPNDPQEIHGVTRDGAPRNFSGLNPTSWRMKEASFGAGERQDPLSLRNRTLNASDNVNPANATQSLKPYSKIAPIRLIQKLTKAGTFTFDLLITAPVAHVFKKIEHESWKIRGKKIFTANPKSQIPNLKKIENWKLKFGALPKVSNISKHLYAPLSISTKDFPWYKKIWHHAQHTRPMWYRKYHQLAFAHYFNWAVLIIFATAMGVGMYNSFLAKPSKSLAALPTAPLRVLSFQGRLTDANDNPITSPSWIRFGIYDNATSTGSAKLWEEVDKVTPDSDGIFSIYLGSDGNGGEASTCVSTPATGACGIPSTLFSQNNALWLGVTVERTAELTPREQLATVAYASNSETLQGLPPITQSGAGTQNVVLALNSSGNLSIGASTTFQSTSGQFTVSGNTLALNTNAGTNGNIVLAPDGLGTIDFQRPLQTSTNNGNIASVPNALTIEDLTAILATSSGQSAFTINQNGTGPIISASASGSPKFTVDNTGNTTANTFYTGLGSTYYINNATSNLNSLTLAANLTVSGNVASNLIPDGNGTRSLGDATHQWLNIYGENIYSNGQLLTSYWNENLGALSPLHTQDDLLIGGTATSDARFQVSGTTGNTYVGGTLGVGTKSPLATTDLRGNSGTTAVASVSGKTSFAGLVVDNSGVGDLFTASTSGLPKFVIQRSGNILDTNYTANGGIFYTDNTGLFKQVFNASANTILHGGTTPTFSAVDLTADVTGTLPINKGGTNTTSIGSNGQVAYSNGSAYAFTSGGSVGNCLTYQGASAPTWGSCGSGSGSNYWQVNGAVISPADLNNDLAIGGNSTSSAKFQVFAETVGVATAGSASSSGNLTFADAAGTNPSINVLNGNTLNINVSPGGDSGTGYTTAFSIAPNGNITSTSTVTKFTSTNPSITANGSSTLTLNSSSNGNIQFFNSNNTITSAGALTLASTITANTTNTINSLSINAGALSGVTGYTQSSGNFDMSGSSGTFQTGTGNVSINGPLAADLIPSGNGSINLGSSSHYYNNLYVNNISTPVGNGTSGFWTVTNNTNLYPSNAADDLLIGGVASNAASFQIFANNYTNDQGTVLAGTATTSGSLTFRGTPGSQTQFKFDLLNGSSLVINRSVGGDKGEAAVLTIGNDGNITDAGNLAVNGSAITTTQTTFNLLTNASTLGIGAGSGTTTINNNLAISGTLSVTGNLISSLIPTSTSINLGSTSKNFGTVFASNLQLPITGGLDGYWQLSSGSNYGVLSPSNLQNDLAIGGNATNSAKFQIFGNTGNATTSGNLTFAGTATTNLIAARNNAGLTIGDTQTGNIILNGGNVGIGTTTPTATLDVLGTASVSSSLTFRAGGGTIQTTKNELLNLGGNTTGGIVFGSNVTSNIVPSLADTYDLGSATNEWNNLYVRQIISPASGGISGYWQLNTGVLAPVNVSNDLVVGGAATSSAKFQVFGNTGNATTSGNFTFNTSGVIQTTNMQQLTLGSASTGPIQLSPKGTTGLFVDGIGNVGVGTTSPLSALQVVGSASLSANLTLTGINTSHTFNINDGGTLGFYTSVGGTAVANPSLFIGTGSGTNAGSVGIGTTSPLGLFNINGSSIGKALSIFNQTGDQDIFTASTSGTTKFVINNSGYVGIGSGLTNPQGILDVASNFTNLPRDLVLGQTTATNLVPNPSFEGNSTTGWNLSQGGTGGSMGASTTNSMFGRYSLLVTTGSAWTEAAYNITVSPNTTYTFSAWVKTSTASNARLQIFDQGTSTGTLSSFHTGDGKWQRLSVTATTGSSTTVVDVDLFTSGSNGSTTYYDGIQFEQASTASPYLDGSLGPGYYWTGTPNNSTSTRIAGSAFAYQSLNSAAGIGAASRGIYPTLQLDQDGTGNIIDASASGVQEFTVTSAGNVYGRKFTDIDNPIYYLDPAGLTVSASVAGSMTFTPASEHDINFLNNSDLNFQSSVGGDTGLTSRLFIQGSTGNVGIGTTSPGYKLTVSGDDSAPGDFTGGFSVLAQSNSNQMLHMGYVTASDYAYIESVKVGTNLEPLALNPRGGNVGIGTTSPAAKLSLIGGTSASSGFGVNNSDVWTSIRNASDGTNAGIIDVTSGGSSTAIGATGYTLALNPSGGNVGIGTTSPQNALNLATGDTLQIGANTDSTYTTMDSDALHFHRTNNGYIDNISGGTLRLGIGNISSNSNGITIGSTNVVTVANSNTSQFGQYIINSAGTSTSHGLRIAAGQNSSANSADFIQFTYGNQSTQVGSIVGNGGGGVTYGSGSDIRIKTDIVDTHFGLNDLLKIPVVDYHLTNNPDGAQQTGFIAQWLYSIYPNAVIPPRNPDDWYNNFDGNDIWTVDYGKVTPLLVKSIQDLNSKLDVATASANAQIAALQTQAANLELGNTGDIAVDPATPSADFTVPTYYNLSDALGNPIKQMGAFVELVVGNLRAGSISTQQLFTNSLAIATSNVSIAGQSLNDYITGVVTNVLNTKYQIQNTSITSPVSQLATNVISPLGDNPQIQIRVKNSGIEIAKDASSSAVASIDNNGNATFSGTLNSQNLAVNGDATISGTLHADKIEANSIAGLQEVVSTLSAQNITNVTNIFFATPSGTATDANPTIGSNSVSNESNQAPTGVSSISYLVSSDSASQNTKYQIPNTFTDIASYSAYFAYVPNLNATTGMFQQGLVSLGPTSLMDTSITGTLSVGSQMMLADNSLNVLGSDFAIQPLRQGGVTFEGGLIAINTNGDLTVNGNAVFNKNLAVNTLSPIAGNDFSVILNGSEGSKDSSPLAQNDKGPNFNIKNASNSAVFAVNQLGDVVASGAATVGKLNFDFVQPALAVSDTEVVATGSAGTAAIKAFQKEVTIDNPNVTANSLIYITPVGTNQTPYLERQASGKSFTVGIPAPLPQAVNFNWLIVN